MNTARRSAWALLAGVLLSLGGCCVLPFGDGHGRHGGGHGSHHDGGHRGR